MDRKTTIGYTVPDELLQEFKQRCDFNNESPNAVLKKLLDGWSSSIQQTNSDSKAFKGKRKRKNLTVPLKLKARIVAASKQADLPLESLIRNLIRLYISRQPIIVLDLEKIEEQLRFAPLVKNQ